MVEDLQKELAAMQAKVAEANKARLAAEHEVEVLKNRPPESPFAALCKCLAPAPSPHAGENSAVGNGDPSQKRAQLRAESTRPAMTDRYKRTKTRKSFRKDCDLLILRPAGDLPGAWH